MTETTEPIIGAITKCLLCTADFKKDEKTRKHCEVCRDLPGEAHKVANQLRKAFKLAQIVLAAGGTPQDVMHQPESFRRLAERAAGLENAASDTTWAIVAVLLNGKPT